MKKNWKAVLRQGFEAPPPEKKEEFLHEITEGKTACGAALPCAVRHGASPGHVSSLSFVCAQAAYIRKWVWAVSAVLFLAAFAGACILKKDILWSLSAVMPVLALALVTESGRSERYGMAELEQASRFPLKSVTLARLGIVGLENLILFCLLIPLVLINSGFGLIQTGVCLTLPYLLTSYLGAWALRKLRGREGDFVCAGIALFVSIGNGLLRQAQPVFYEGIFMKWGLAAGIFLATGAVYQYRQIIKAPVAETELE